MLKLFEMRLNKSLGIYHKNKSHLHYWKMFDICNFIGLMISLYDYFIILHIYIILHNYFILLDTFSNHSKVHCRPEIFA